MAHSNMTTSSVSPVTDMMRNQTIEYMSSTLSAANQTHNATFSPTTPLSRLGKELTTMATMNVTQLTSMVNSTLETLAANGTQYNSSIAENVVDHPHASLFMSTQVILPLILVIVICSIVAGALFYIRRNRLEKLRHHLMPVYNFDPADDGEDWETQLLDESVTSPGFGNLSTGMSMGGLKLDTGLTKGLKINPTLRTEFGETKLSSPSSPTASSGLLNSSNLNGQLYTNERHHIV
ncbi:hypothetical protein HDE_09913 [Halotydeus destructor]|nr:hypothetical protein HDE_09913 [Halotydeus destructor]